MTVAVTVTVLARSLGPKAERGNSVNSLNIRNAGILSFLTGTGFKKSRIGDESPARQVRKLGELQVL